MQAIAHGIGGLLLVAMLAFRAHGDERVGDRGDPVKIVFHGLESFSPEDVRSAVGRDFHILLAGHRQAPLAGFLLKLAAQLEAGFQNLGFPDVRVRAEFDGRSKQVVVSVTEGPRYTCGRVTIEGARTIPVDQLLRRLTQPFPPADASVSGFRQTAAGDVPVFVNKEGKAATLEDPIWNAGKAARFGAIAQANYTAAVKRALQEFGFFDSQLQVDVVAEAGQKTAALRVRIQQEGSPAIARRIEVRGARKNKPQDVLRYLGLTEGMVLNREALTRTERLLWQAARFLNYNVTSEPAAAAGEGVSLVIELTEYDHAPALFQPFSPEQELMLKVRDRFIQFDQWEDDAVIATSGQFPVQIEAIVSAKKGLFARIRSAPEAAKKFDYTLVASPEHGLSLVSGHRKRMIAVPLMTGMRFDRMIVLGMAVHASDKPEPGSLGSKWEFGVTADGMDSLSPVTCKLQLAPIAFVCLASRSQWSHAGGVTTVALNGTRMKVETSSARLLEFVLMDDKNETPFFTMRCVSGALGVRRQELTATLQGFANDYDAQRPLSSLCRFLCEEAIAWRNLSDTPENRRSIAALRKLLAKPLLEPLDRVIAIPSEPQRDSLKIPMDASKLPGQGSLTAMYAMCVGGSVIQAVDQLCPYGSWPSILSREAVFIASGNAPYADDTIYRLYASQDNGPFCYLAAGYLMRYVNQAMSRQFAGRGLERLKTGDFRKDYRLLFARKSALTDCLFSAAEVLGGLDDDEAELIGKLLEPEQAALLLRVVRVLRAHRQPGAGDGLPAALDDLWETSLRKQVEKALRQLLPAEPVTGEPRPERPSS